MHVIATAGHVDHGKSTLVRALTGMEPDRWAEERRRGMTIDLGFAWAALPSGERVAFVDVPGHERFVTNMLAGVGPVPAVLIIVAADEGWMPQSAEHLAAIDALGVRHGLLVVTRADLADPAGALAEARARVAATSLGDMAAVTVSGATGEGVPALRAALDRLVAGLPEPDVTGPVRIWIDRAFTIKGSGTVVTGTLPAGTVRTGDELLLDGRPVRVRSLQALKETAGEVTAVARVAVNLRGVDRDEVARGMALTGAEWTYTDTTDVRVDGIPTGDLPREPVLHIGSAAVPARLRPLGADTARLVLARPLPLHIGDRALLRDPGARRVAGLTVLDVRPPALRRRGAAAARARELATGVPDATALVRRHGLLREADLRAMGAGPGGGTPVTAGWLADPEHWAALRARLAEEVDRHAKADPLAPGLPVEAARSLLDLPDRRLVPALATPPLRLADGRVHGPAGAGLPAPVAEAVRKVRADLEAEPFQAPDANRLAELRLTGRALAAAVRAGALLRIADGIVLLPGADDEAARVLAALPQPFTVSEARRALGTSRRIAVPLLEHLDRRGLTVRDGDRRRVR